MLTDLTFSANVIIFLFLCTLLNILSASLPNVYSIRNESPITINDSQDDSVTVVNGNNTFKRDSLDIFSVDYFFDVNSVNATIWFSKDISPHKPYDKNFYGLLIDADTRYDTGFHGIDYQISFIQSTSSWVRTIQKLSPDGRVEVISNESKYLKPANTSDSISLSAPVGLPFQYHKLAFYAVKINKSDTYTIDTTNWIFIPSPISSLELIPSAVRIKPGEEVSVTAKINSSLPVKSELYLYDKSNTSDLRVFIEPEKLMLPSLETVSANIKIKAASNASTNFLVLPISVTLNPSEKPVGKIRLTDNVFFPNVQPEKLSMESHLILDLERVGEGQNFWKISISDLISLCLGAIAIWASLPSIVSQFLSHFYKPKLEAFIPPRFFYTENESILWSELDTHINIRNSTLRTFQLVIEIIIDKPWVLKTNAQGLYPHQGLKGGYPLRSGFWIKTDEISLSGNGTMAILFPYIPKQEEAILEIVIHPKIHLSQFRFPSNYGEVYLKPIYEVFRIKKDGNKDELL